MIFYYTIDYLFVLFTNCIHFLEKRVLFFFYFHMSTMDGFLRPMSLVQGPIYMMLMGGYKWAMMSVCIIGYLGC